MSGWTDVPLSERGRREARALGRRFDQGFGFQAAYSSPLERARETARISMGAHRALRVVDDVREIHCGEVDGMPVELVKARYAALWAENLRQDNDDFRWPGGESYRELRARVLTAVGAIAAAHPGQRVLVFTHAGVISQVLGFLHGTRPARWEAFRPSNGSLTEVDWENDHGALFGFDDHAHVAWLEQEPLGG